MSAESPSQLDALFERHLENGKTWFNGKLLEMIGEMDLSSPAARQFTLLMRNFDKLEVLVTRDPLAREEMPTLKFGLDDDYDGQDSQGFTLQLSCLQAITLINEMPIPYYLALCEAGIFKGIETLERVTDGDERMTETYENDMNQLEVLREIIQSSEGAQKDKIYVQLYFAQTPAA